ncbi:MAG: ATP-binding protein [Luteolibacter sp.]
MLEQIGCAIGKLLDAKSGIGRAGFSFGCRRGRASVLFGAWVLWSCFNFTALAQTDDRNVNTSTPAGEDMVEVLDPTWGVGSWIWAGETADKQTCRFWRSFEIPPGVMVARAQLHIGVDNGYRLMLDGRELGTGSDWRSITEYEIGLLLKPGRHVLAVEGFNDNREAGMLFGLRIELADGKVIMIPSDTSWRIAPADQRGWESKQVAPAHWASAVVVSKFLPRNGLWQERRPTMTVKVPVLQPVELYFWKRGWFQAILWGFIVVTVLFCLRLMARLAVQSKAQALLNIERARIARDIHDELGARLTELALEGEVIQTELPTGSAVRPKLEALCEKARAASGAMDEVVWMVNSRRDTLRDFANFACRHAQRFLASSPIRCRLDVDGDLPELVFELPMRRNLLLGVKEALNNAVKYSKAEELFLRIHCQGQTLLVVVEDNGAGFDLELADSVRNGLTSMTERMKELGGRCQIETQPGAGCRVEFQVPLPKSSSRQSSVGSEADLPLSGMRGAALVSRGGEEVTTR